MQFKEADPRYLLRAPDVFASIADALPWRVFKLSTTFRMTGNMVRFLNESVLGWPLFNTPNAAGAPVTYLKGNSYGIAAGALAHELIALLKQGRIQPEDIFILAPSIRSGSSGNPKPFNRLENALVKAGFPCYSPASDDEKLDSKEDVMRGKIVCSTFHQVKGLERKVVVVFNFCKDYFAFAARDMTEADQLVCPNAVYMGASVSRALLCALTPSLSAATALCADTVVCCY